MAAPFTISVTDVDKTSNPKDVQFRMDYSTTLPQYSKEPAQANILRRASDLQWLLAQLAAAYPECIVPPLPACVSLKSGGSGGVTTYSAIPSAQVDERFKEVVQMYLLQIVSHPVFVGSSCVQQFFESGNQFVPYTTKQSGSSVYKFLKSVAKSGRSVKEVDPAFDDRKMEISEVQTCVERCCKTLEKMAKADRALGLAYTEVAAKLLEFGNVVPNVHLASGVRKFAAAVQKSGMTYAAVGEMESLYTYDTLVQHSHACQSAESTLENRLDALQEYENTCKATHKKKQAADKLKASSQIKVDKVETALSELTEAKNQEAAAKDLVKKISDSVLNDEWPAFLKLNEQVLASSLVNHVRIQLASERQQIREYDQIVADLRKSQETLSRPVAADNQPAATVIQQQQQEKIAVDVL